LLSASALRLSKHDAPPRLLLLRPTERRRLSPLSDGVAVMAPGDFSNAPLLQQSDDAHDMSRRRPNRNSAGALLP
jgi:hypothetical protein